MSWDKSVIDNRYDNTYHRSRMTQVSKHPLKKEIEERVFEILLETIASLKNPEEINDFIEDFLSPVEKIMLAKRLAIAVLLGRGYDYRQIREILKVTPGTIAGVNLKLKYAGRGYKKVVEKILKEEKIGKIFEKIGGVAGVALGESLPPKGKDWSKWQKARWQERKIRSNPL